jgi:hypothetical protein
MCGTSLCNLSKNPRHERDAGGTCRSTCRGRRRENLGLRRPEELDAEDWQRKTIQNELSHLDASLDRYLAAMAPIRSRGAREEHLRLYDRLTEILITRDLASADELIADLDHAIGRVGSIPRSRTAGTAG